MMNCRNTKRIIDEADNVDVLPFDVSAHVDSCADCRHAADERRALAGLLHSAARVSAPANFDVVLRIKLNERRAKRWSVFAIHSFYLRFGGAAAMIACLIVGGELVLKTNSTQPGNPIARSNSADATNPTRPTPGGPIAEGTPSQTPKTEPSIAPQPEIQVQRQVSLIAHEVHPGMMSRPHRPAYISTTNRFDPTTEANTVFLIQGAGSQSKLAIPWVTVGGQQPVVNVSSHMQSGQEVRVAF